MRERGLSFPLLVDGDPLIERYGIERTPWLVVIDGAQRIVYTRPASSPSPIDVAKAVRETLNGLIGERAVPLPAAYPPPYDLHLRGEGSQSSQLAADAAGDAEWKPWAERYLGGVGADERVADLPPRGAVADGRAAIALAREWWTQRYGAEAVVRQAPFRAYRRGTRWLVVADTDAVLRFPYEDGQTRITTPGARLVDLPAGPRNHHWTKNLIASADGRKLYVTVGSNSNAAENGLEAEQGRGPSGKSTRPAVRIVSTRRACAIRTAWPGNRRRACCGSSSTSATSSAAIWFPTI
ncbi:MAG: hypothetical protein QM661_08605 [Solimonas sp.]